MLCAGCDQSGSWLARNDAVSVIGIYRKMGDMQEYEVIVDTMPIRWTVYRGQLFVFLC